MAAKTSGSYGIPIAIVIAGLLIGGSIFLSRTGGSVASGATFSGSGHAGGGGVASSEFRMPDDMDHVRGNPDAAISIVEFSDFECPFCARLHPTLQRIVDENEDVKWIYRHFPLSSIHFRALGSAVASECMARLGGNAGFWTFADAAFSNQSHLGDALYEEVARTMGVDIEEFQSCRNDRSITADIQEDLDEAVGTGGRGTPYVIVVSPSGELVPFSGALPYEQISSLISQVRNN